MILFILETWQFAGLDFGWWFFWLKVGRWWAKKVFSWGFWLLDSGLNRRANRFLFSAGDFLDEIDVFVNGGLFWRADGYVISFEEQVNFVLVLLKGDGSFWVEIVDGQNHIDYFKAQGSLFQNHLDIIGLIGIDLVFVLHGLPESFEALEGHHGFSQFLFLAYLVQLLLCIYHHLLHLVKLNIAVQ